MLELLNPIRPAFAQDAGMGAVFAQLAPLILIFVVFYFLLIRPQQKRQKEHKAMLLALKRGDRVVTAGGILAEVAKVREDSNEVEVDIAPNVRVKVIRDTISAVIKPQAANDSGAAAKAG